jgi:hypothetical protein
MSVNAMAKRAAIAAAAFNRSAAITDISVRVFNRNPVVAHRTGNKYLRAVINGPKVERYYPEKIAPIARAVHREAWKAAMAANPPVEGEHMIKDVDGEMIDNREGAYVPVFVPFIEQRRALKLEKLKRRGKGPPPKGAGKRTKKKGAKK